MAQVLSRCPQTGHAVPTGFRFDLRSYEAVALEGYAVSCLACGELHRWDKKDAFLETVNAPSLPLPAVKDRAA